MFTGIVEELGTVERVEPRGATARIAVRAAVVADGLRPGESVAVNGVCLTAVDPSAEGFAADVMAETLRRSSLGGLRPGDRVNLERAVTPTTRLGGHLVQGHVDGVAQVLERREQREGDVRFETVRFSLPAGLARYLVEKGSIAVDGVSLTVAGLSGPGDETGWFEVGLIPTTLAETTLGRTGIGARVNLEVDVLAKYTERLLGQR
jgi:riboflavin synthase